MSYNKKIDYLFVAFPSFLAECDELTPQDKAVFLYFVSTSYRNWNPSYRELSKNLSLGNSTIKKAIVKLQILGFIIARTSIRGEGVKNEINSYKVNLSNPERWCPTLDLKEEIERCYEMNGKKAPIFKLVYLNKKALNEDVEKSIKLGKVVQSEAVEPKSLEDSMANDLPLKIVSEYEEMEPKLRRISIWQSCADFSLWLEYRGSLLNEVQKVYFKNIFSEWNFTNEKYDTLKGALFNCSHKDFLKVIDSEKLRLQTKKKNEEDKSI